MTDPGPGAAPRAWLAPGQVETRRLPVTGERAPAPEALDPETWRLEVRGLVARPLTLTLTEVLDLPQEEHAFDLHCVTGWSRRATPCRGTRLRHLLERAGVLPAARFVRFEAYSARGHDTSLPLEVAREDTWLVHTLRDRPLGVEHGGPLRTLTPSRYLYKSLKWIRRIELLAEDRLGFWERDQGYHNGADPWREERYVAGDLKTSELESLRRGRRLGPFRGRLVLGADLRGWDPLDRDLRGLVLKNANLAGARLAGVDLRGANLCMSDLTGADLAGADLRDTDLEGVRLAGADLSGADVSGASLIALQLHPPGRPDLAARVTGLRWLAAPGAGLLEETEAFLRASDALEPDSSR